MFGIVIPVHNQVMPALSLLNSLDNQIGSNKFKVIIVHSGNYTGYSKLLSYCPENFQYECIKVSQNSYWARSIWTGIKKILKSSECSHILLMNDDILIDSHLISRFVTLSNSGHPKHIYFSPVFDKDGGDMLSGTTKVDFGNLKITEYFSLENKPPNLSDLASGRCTLYPVDFFNHGGKVRWRIFPHHYADIDLSCQARSQGYFLICDLQTRIHSKNDFSSSVHSKNFIKKYISIKSPDRFISWFMFWFLYARNNEKLGLLKLVFVFYNYIRKRFS
jgi:GT2 family glycosyltransferase